MKNSKAGLHIQSIESIMTKILASNPSKIVIRNWKHPDNLLSMDRVILKDFDEATEKQICFSSQRNRLTFTLVVHLLAKIHKILLTDSYYTRRFDIEDFSWYNLRNVLLPVNIPLDYCPNRELYYEEVGIFRNQKTLDTIVQIICCLLNCPPWELGIVAAAKGLVAGPLLIKLNDENVIDCSSPGGTLIPHEICMENAELRSSADYVLLIEKDATFQRLLNENILDKLKGSLLVTGKGFPDINARILVHKLSRNLKLPILALVDSDPFGIAIMCIYRFGSINMSFCTENLVTPEVRWLGVHPSDLLSLNIVTMPFQKSDYLKLGLLMTREFIKSRKKLLKEVEILSKLGRKAEIEAICDISGDYLTNKSTQCVRHHFGALFDIDQRKKYDAIIHDASCTRPSVLK